MPVKNDSLLPRLKRLRLLLSRNLLQKKLQQKQKLLQKK
jgi:hypothetical protein